MTKIGCIADNSKRASTALKLFLKRYNFIDLNSNPTKEVDLIITLGGDGFMLHTLHHYMMHHIPFYGMNCGSVGFLMNRYEEETILERIEKAKTVTLHPLHMIATTALGKEHHKLAINEVSLLRETNQAAHIKICVDNDIRLKKLVCDGILVSTPAGSTAYNLSANGPIIPIGADILALTAISPFRPRRWRGALLKHHVDIRFEIYNPKKRPVSAVADFMEVRDVISVLVREERKIKIQLLFDPGHSLEDRIIKEQFIP